MYIDLHLSIGSTFSSSLGLQIINYITLYIYILYTWNPNGAPCFDWKFGLVLGGKDPFKNRGLFWVPGIYIS